jgi:dipeptidyl-peptidase-3
MLLGLKRLLLILGITLMLAQSTNAIKDDSFYFLEQFADLRILRYDIPGFNELTLKEKTLAYYLSEAARAGRDIYWDQNYKHNLTIRRILEQIVQNFHGDKSTDAYKNFMVYAKRVWFSNGIHHHYSNDKIMPTFSESEFRALIDGSLSDEYPVLPGESVASLIDRMVPIMFDPNIDAKKVVLDADVDKVVASAVNFYEGVTEEEVLEYYKSITVEGDETPISYGLNSKKVKENGKVVEKVSKIDGLYKEAIVKIVANLELALPFTESDLQRATLEKLIEYYKTGDLRDFDKYNILWIQDTQSKLDTINGYIEVYDDPLGQNGSWESVVSIKDQESTLKFGILSQEAQWFENHSPISPRHKREKVTGVSYKIINVVQESGASSPATPIGINLPNADWIRSNYGSKSVSLGNIEHAYDQASKGTVLDEFFLPEQREWIRAYGSIADRLHTGLHEVIGHASGQLEPGVSPPHVTLKSYASALEEARADLVGLYYIGDQHLVDIGVSPSTDIIKASYTQYINNGLLKQLARIDFGKNIEEAHMRNRQMIAKWAYEQGHAENIIERIDIATAEGPKTYFVINDFNRLRELFGDLLHEVQRIKSRGDYEAGKNLIETYGVEVDEDLHAQVKQRWSKLGIAPYAGFVNPYLLPQRDDAGNIIDVMIYYPNDFAEQMIIYGTQYSWLPNYPK